MAQTAPFVILLSLTLDDLLVKGGGGRVNWAYIDYSSLTISLAEFPKPGWL